VSEDGSSKTDARVVANSDIFGMEFVDVYKLGNPNALSDFDATQTMQPWPDRSAPRDKKRYLMEHPIEKVSEHQMFLNLCDKDAYIDGSSGGSRSRNQRPQKPRFTAK
jgi:hypothetical protein